MCICVLLYMQDCGEELVEKEAKLGHALFVVTLGVPQVYGVEVISIPR